MAGAVVGAVTEIGIQSLEMALDLRSEYSLTDIGVSAALGAVGGVGATATKGSRGKDLFNAIADFFGKAFGKKGKSLEEVVDGAIDGAAKDLEKLGKAGKNKPSEKGTFPDEIFGKDAPDYRSPTGKPETIGHGKYNSKTKGYEKSLVDYDEFGRQRHRTDYTTHGRPKDHPETHHHEREYGPGYNPHKDSGVLDGPAPGHPEEPPDVQY